MQIKWWLTGYASALLGFTLCDLATPDPRIKECEKSLPRDKHCILVAIEENRE